jgi:hypothetical protein
VEGCRWCRGIGFRQLEFDAGGGGEFVDPLRFEILGCLYQLVEDS